MVVPLTMCPASITLSQERIRLPVPVVPSIYNGLHVIIVVASGFPKWIKIGIVNQHQV